MFKCFLCVLFTVVAINVYGQSGLEQMIINTRHGREHLRLSLITCTTGREITEWAGHSAIRLIDSTKTDESRDLIYNFGIFSFDEHEFPGRFILDDIDVVLEVAPFSFFMRAYGGEDRGMTETVLLLNDSEKNSIVDALTLNVQPSKRGYKYDFVFDNCTTRIRDLFTQVLGHKLVFGKAAINSNVITYRQVCYAYTERNPALKFLAGIFLSQEAEQKVPDNTASMFVPSYLFRGFRNGTIRGEKLCSEPISILPDKQKHTSGIDIAGIITFIIAALVIVGSIVPRFAMLGKIMSSFVLVVSGLLGLALLYTWLGGVNVMCRNNYNVLWLLPVNVALPFFSSRAKRIFAIVALTLLCIAIAIHVAGIQVLPVKQLWPLMIALMFIYIRMIKSVAVA